MTPEPKLAVVKTLYESNSRDIVATLRRNADAIESGQHGDVERLVFVMLANVKREGSDVADQKVEVFGMGQNDGGFWKDLGILQGGVAHLTKMITP